MAETYSTQLFYISVDSPGVLEGYIVYHLTHL